MLLDEKTYLFNPFNLSSVKDEAISEQINELACRYIVDADNPYDVAFNIELGANILYLYGEMIARITRRYSEKKLDNSKSEMLESHRLRKDYPLKNPGEKIPAMSYFDALAVQKYQKERNEEYKDYEMLTRFKYAYDSLEAKMNAWKRKLDTFKYDLVERI